MATGDAPTNWGRIAAFFFGYMGLFVLALPALLLAIYQWQAGSLDWPPPTAQVAHGPEWAVADGQFSNPEALLKPRGPVVDARAVVPGAEAAAATVAMDGTLAAAAVGPGVGEALATNYKVSQRTPTGDGVEAVRTVDGMTGKLAAEPGRALIVLGVEPGTAEARWNELPGLTSVAAGPAPKVASSSQRWIAFAFLGFWVVLQFFLFGRMASWAAAVPPSQNAQPVVSASELKARLKGLAALDQPFEVKDEGDELLADWKWYDAKWLDLMKLRGARRANRIVLRLDPETRTVRAQDRTAELDWGAGVDGASLKWKAERGINFFHYQAGREVGLIWKEGSPEVSLTHQWRFDLNDMKQPLIRIVREAGWTWRPVVTFVKAFGG